MSIDLTPAAQRLADLVAAVRDDQLGAPTPCPDYTVGDLLDHIGGLAVAFREAAEKSGAENPDGPPPGDVANLAADWRTRIPADLAALGEAWRAPEAWEGVARAGGIEMPGEIAGVVALEEVVVHGWDLATATGHDVAAAPEELEAVIGFFTSFPDEAREPGFGLAHPVPEDAPLLDRAVALSGRDPDWARTP